MQAIVKEMKNFLGLTYLTGIIKKPQLKMYSTDDPVFGTPLFPKTMPCNRFMAILAFLHFNYSSWYQADSCEFYNIKPALL
jgi:hypothetical protein